ncbi:MAG: RibD family protein [Candidatus Nanopelagicaceae bacterium]
MFLSYYSQVHTVATLVMGSDGSTAKDGSSAGVSTNTDRERFLKRRREFDCIIIGGNTARSERYAITPCPLVVISRHKSNVLITNPNAFWWNLDPAEALAKAKREFGPDILIEAGPGLLNEFLKLGLVDQLEISITPISGGDHLIDLNEALRGFEITEDRKVDDTRFVTAKKR